MGMDNVYCIHLPIRDHSIDKKQTIVSELWNTRRPYFNQNKNKLLYANHGIVCKSVQKFIPETAYGALTTITFEYAYHAIPITHA
jgi:hypothetical protein